MSNASLPVDILLLAFIAVVVAYRLYRKFGTQVDVDEPHDHKNSQPKNTQHTSILNDDFVTDYRKGPQKSEKATKNTETNSPQALFVASADQQLVTKTAQPIIDRITHIDHDFDVAEFLRGASIAYEMLTMAHARGDTQTLQPLVNKALFNSLCTEIKQRDELKQVLEIELIGINDMQIVQAELYDDKAVLQVAIESEQSYALYDENKDLVQGDNEEVLLLRDIWHLERDLTSANPNWTLIRIDEDNDEDEDEDNDHQTDETSDI